MEDTRILLVPPIMHKAAMTNLCIGLYVNISFNFSEINAPETTVELFGSFMFNAPRPPQLPDGFPEWLYHCLATSVKFKGSSFFASSPAFGVVTIFHCSHSNRCLVIAHCGFNVYFTAR